MQEIWKDINGYEKLYQISNTGKVKSFHGNGRILKQAVNHKGYCMVKLQKNGNKKTISIHRLVAQAFIPNPKNKRTINHKDLNKKNNYVDNLEWMTNSENLRHAYSNGINPNKNKNKGSTNGMSKLNESKVKLIKRLIKQGIEIIKIAKYYNVDKRTIIDIKGNITWKHVI